MRGLSASVLTLFSAIVFAQAPAPIERVKITDNDLTCLSAHNEFCLLYTSDAADE